MTENVLFDYALEKINEVETELGRGYEGNALAQQIRMLAFETRVALVALREEVTGTEETA